LIQSNDPTHIVACEFRNYSKNTVPVGDVEAFACKLKDIQANKGVIVTPKGYQRGAIATAKHYDIVLFKLREMQGANILNKYSDLNITISKNKKYWVLERDDCIISIGEGNITEKTVE